MALNEQYPIKQVKLPNGEQYPIEDYRIGNTAVGNSSTPVYWNGSAFAAVSGVSASDEKVKQTVDNSTTTKLPLLTRANASESSGTAGASKYTSYAAVKPSQSAITASRYYVNTSGTDSTVYVVKTSDGGWEWTM